MFRTQIVENNNIKRLIASNGKGTELIVNLNEGARVEQLILSNKIIIKELSDFHYDDSFASAILFPFVSRIKNGKYTYQNTNYQLKCNNKGHALHGLVFDQTFLVEDCTTSVNEAKIKLTYSAAPQKGFPFSYDMEVGYSITKNALKLDINVKNTSSKSFPFTIGWHPYFYTDNLQETSLTFQSNKQVVFDDELITKELITKKHQGQFSLKNRMLDDCFLLNFAQLEMKTTAYSIQLSSTVQPSFLQLYTPKGLPCIAIEFQSGVSNSFNNSIGLQTINSNESKVYSWQIQNI